MEDAVILGIQGKDKITGLTGTITAHSRWLTGEDRIQIAPPVDSDGKHVETQWYDRSRIEMLDSGAIAL